MNKKHLPVQFNDRIYSLAIDYILMLITAFTVVFLDIPIIMKYVLIFISWALPNLMIGYIYKATIGQIISKTVIVDMNYNKLNYKTFFLRESSKYLMIIFTLGLYLIIGLIYTGNRIDRRAPHDLVFATMRVHKEAYLK